MYWYSIFIEQGFISIIECAKGWTCTTVANCGLIRGLQEKIDATRNLHEKFKLQTQFYERIKSLICGKEQDSVCCDPGKKVNELENNSELNF